MSFLLIAMYINRLNFMFVSSELFLCIKTHVIAELE